ncbi:MAG: isoprenyl transferase [bacterium]
MQTRKEGTMLPDGMDLGEIPRHVGIIMDGNGRWAGQRHLPRIAGHKVGVESVRAAVKTGLELGVEALTIYAFSTENWLRPRLEVGQIMKLLIMVLRDDVMELKANGVRLMASGRISDLPKSVREELRSSIKILEGGKNLVLNLALNYGGRQEIVDAVNMLIKEGAGEVNEKMISGRLYTSPLPDPDLIIRTSGEMRLSNFLLWQSAYSEFYFTPLLWPDFRREQFIEALRSYQGRKRRFGGV